MIEELHVSPSEFSWLHGLAQPDEPRRLTCIYNRWSRLRKLPMGTEVKVIVHWDWARFRKIMDVPLPRIDTHPFGSDRD